MSLLSNLKDLNGIFRINARRRRLDPGESSSRIDISNFTLGLYKFTFVALMACSILSTTRSFFGDPIKCESTTNGAVDHKVFETFCWISGSYVAPLNHTRGQLTRIGFGSKEHQKRYLNYYQWIPFIFFIQALIIYAPYYFWKYNEGGRISRLIKIAESYYGQGEVKKEEGGAEKDLETPEGDDDDSTSPDDPDIHSLNILAKVLTRRQGSHNWYALKYIISHLLAIGAVLGILYGTNIMLDGDFSHLGSSLTSLSDIEDDWQDFDNNPLKRVFPRLIQCQFRQKLGRSGTPETHNAICILPLNILNEKIFVWMWFWFLFLFVWTAFNTVLDLFLILCSLPRVFILRHFVDSTRHTSAFTFERLIQVATFGDWFVLFQLRKNLDGTSFRILLEEFSRRLSNNSALVQTTTFRYTGHHHPHTQTPKIPPPPPKQPPGPAGDSRPGSPPPLTSNRISRV